MRAALCTDPGSGRVELCDVADPRPGPGQVLVEVAACGVCRTDLHLVDGELPEPKVPVVPGHEIVGRVAALGDGVEGLAVGQRVGVPWLGWTCGQCAHCRAGRENLCEQARFHGYTLDGGYAQRVVADARYCFPLPEDVDDAEAAPLLCAGLIGHRAYRLALDSVGATPDAIEPARTLGLYGFGAAAHILAQTAVATGHTVHAFTRPGDWPAQRLARQLGAAWTGASGQRPPAPLDAAILFAPVGELVVQALEATRPGGAVVAAGIHMSDIPAFPYRLLWRERLIRSVANLTRADARSFFALQRKVRVRTHVTAFPLAQANAALAALRGGETTGAVVLTLD